MKKLLLLIVLCAYSVTTVAQTREMSYQLNDSIEMLSPWKNVVFQPLRNKELIPTKVFSVWKDKPSMSVQKAMKPYPRAVVVRPMRIIIHQQCVMYGSQVIFLQEPRVYIEPAKIVYEPPSR